MTKSGFWKKDWFWGLIVTLLLLFSGGSQIIQSLERSAYDWGVRASSRAPSDKVAVIAIDKQSIDNIGRWPWSRDVHAKMIDGLAKAKAKVIGYTVFFSEPQLDPGLGYVNKMLELFPKPASEGEMPVLREDQQPLYQLLREAESSLNTDRKLAASFTSAGNVVLPMLFRLGEPRGKPDKPLPEFVRKNAIPVQGTRDDLPLLTSGVDAPIVPELGNAAAGVGHLTPWQDVDGAIRTEPLVITHFDEFYPRRWRWSWSQKA